MMRKHDDQALQAWSKQVSQLSDPVQVRLRNFIGDGASSLAQATAGETPIPSGLSLDLNSGGGLPSAALNLFGWCLEARVRPRQLSPDWSLLRHELANLVLLAGLGKDESRVTLALDLADAAAESCDALRGRLAGLPPGWLDRKFRSDEGRHETAYAFLRKCLWRYFTHLEWARCVRHLFGHVPEHDFAHGADRYEELVAG